MSDQDSDETTYAESNVDSDTPSLNILDVAGKPSKCTPVRRKIPSTRKRQTPAHLRGSFVDKQKRITLGIIILSLSML